MNFPRAAVTAALAALGLAAASFAPAPLLAQPRIDGCALLPANNIWNVRVDALPVEPDSDRFIDSIGRTSPVHPDFGAGDYPPGSGSPIGIPFVTVPGSQARIPVEFLYDDESDPGPYPIPPSAPIEGGPQSTGDRHVLVLDRDACVLYELFSAYPLDGGARFRADAGAIFDLDSNALRPETWTSADAAGLPVLPGLVRYDEVAAGAIPHALRFTAPRTRRAYVWPARHFASSRTDPELPPMGLRMRLRADFETASMSQPARVVAEALKTYGMMLADNGSSWFLSGVPDERWDNDALRDLRRVTGADFEAVDTGNLIVDPNSGETPGPTAGECQPDATTLCLGAGRFRVRADWTDPVAAGAIPPRQAQVEPLSEDSGYLWFFDPANVEVLVKVLDGCATNGRFWVFAAGLTDVAVDLRVDDLMTGAVATYRNPAGRAFLPIQDTNAFAGCRAGAGATFDTVSHAPNLERPGR